MFADVSPPFAGLLAAWFTAILYGMLLIVSFAYVRLITGRGIEKRSEWFLLAVVCLQVLISGAHMTVCLQQAVYGFLYAPNAFVYFGDNGTHSHLTQTALYVLNNLIADGVLVWRLYVVYDRAIWTVIPYALLITGSAVCGFAGVRVQRNLHTPQALLGPEESHWAYSQWALSITIQVSASCLIAWKVWVAQAVLPQRLRSSRPMSVIWMILESGAILSAMTVMLLGFYAAKKGEGAVIIAINAQLSALVPATILLRVSLQRYKLTTSNPSSSISQQSNPRNFFTQPMMDVNAVHRGSSPDPSDLELYQYETQKAKQVSMGIV